MPTIFEQLESALGGTGVTGSVGGQVTALGSVADTLAGLAAHPPDSIDDFGTALSQLQLPHIDAGSDLLNQLGGVRDALPSDMSSVAQGLTDGLASLGGILQNLTATLGAATGAVSAVARATQVDLRCSQGSEPAAPPASPPPASPPPASPPPASAPPPPAANPAATAAATAPLDTVSTALAVLPASPEVGDVLDLAQRALHSSVLDDLLPAFTPIVDEIRDPLTTLAGWKGKSQAQVRDDLAVTIDAAASLVTAQLDRALAPLATDVAGVAPSLGVTALGQTADAIVAALGDLRTAVASGDLSATGPSVTALNARLDELDAARAAFPAAALSAVLPHLQDFAGGIEDALVLAGGALDPPSTLDFVSPLARSFVVRSAASPISELQQWLDALVSWLQDLVGALDLSAVKTPLETIANEAHTVLDAFDSGVAEVAVTVQQLFGQVEELVDAVDTAGLVAQVESALHDFETQISGELADLFAPVRDAVHDAVTEIDGAVDSFDPSQVVSALQDAMTQLESVLSGAADAVQEIATTIQSGIDELQNVSFAPITDEVVQGIDDVTSALEAIDTSQLTPPLQIALQGALVVLPEDLKPVTDPIVADFHVAVDGSAIPALDELRGEPQRLLDEVQKFEPVTLIGDALSQPFNELLGQMDAFAPSSLLEPVRAQIDALKQRLRENVDPAQLLQPLEAPFQQLLQAFDQLRPETIVQPLQDAVNAAISSVFAAVPIDDVFHELDEALGRAQEAAAIGDKAVQVMTRVHEVLAAFADAQAQTDAWLEPILNTVDAAGADPALTPHLQALTEALDDTTAAALTTRIDAAIDPLLGELTGADPHAKLAAIVQAKNRVSRAQLDALPASAEHTAIAAALDRFDPLSHAFASPFEPLHALETQLAAAKTSAHELLDAEWDANVTGPDGALGPLHGLAAGPQVGQSVRDVVQHRFTEPLVAFFSVTAPLAQAVDAVLSELKKLVDELDAKLTSLLTGPGSLGDIKDSIEALVDRLHAVDLGFLTTSLHAVFADVRAKLAALDPANLAAAVSAEFDDLLGQLDLSQALPAADVQTLDDDYQHVVDKLRALDPKTLVVDVVQPAFEQTVTPVLAAFDLSATLDALVGKVHDLEDELGTELDKVNEAYKRLRAAMPSMDLGDIAGAAVGAVGDLAGSVGFSL